MSQITRTRATSPRLSSATDRPSRWKLLLRRQRRKLRPLLWGVALLVVLGAVVLMGREAAGQANITSLRERLGALGALAGLRIGQVRIEGRAQTPEPLLNAALGVITGQPILAFSVAEARARLESLSWVQSATVSRRLPGTIVVDLVERRPFAVWQNQGKFTLVDRDGRAVPDQDIAAFGQLPLVVGTGAAAAAAGLLDALEKYPAIQSHVVAAVRVGDRRWNLHLTNGGDVLLPEGQAPAALARLAELQQEHALLDRPLQVIDLRLPDRMVLRPAPDPKTADPHPADPHIPDAHLADKPATPSRETR